MMPATVLLASLALAVGPSATGGSAVRGDSAASQFTGCITYGIEFEVSGPPASLPDLQAQFGKEVVRCFGTPGYKVVYEGKAGTLWYLSSLNREYQLERGATVLSVIDGSKPFLKVASTSSEGTAVSVLGHSLTLFTMHFVDGSEERFWFAPDFPMDPAPYSAYRFAGQELYFRQARSAFLKYEWRSTRGYVRRDTAVSIQSGEPKAETFELPHLPEQAWPP